MTKKAKAQCGFCNVSLTIASMTEATLKKLENTKTQQE